MARHHAPLPPGADKKEAPITRESLREALGLFVYVLPYKAKFAAAFAALVASSLLALVFPYLAGSLVDRVLAEPRPPAEQHDQPAPAGSQVNAAPTEPPSADAGFWQNSINRAMVVLLAALALQAFILYWKGVWFSEVGERTLADLRRAAYARLIRLPMAFHSRRRVGELASRMASDLHSVHDALIWSFPQLLRHLIILLGGVVLLSLISRRLTVAMLAAFPPLIVAAYFLGRKIRRVSREAQDRFADSHVIVEETLQGIASVKAFANETFEQGRYRDSVDAYVRTVLRNACYRALLTSFIVMGVLGSVAAVLWYGATLVHIGWLTAGDLTRFLLYTMFVGGAMSSFAELYGHLQRTLGASHRVRDLLRETPEPLDAPVAAASPLDPARGLKLSGDVEFEQVTFSYPSRKDVPVLRHLSLKVRAGERVALVGPSGAGKSTLVALLLRFYEPDGGRLLLDGRDARTCPLAELRGQMAMVPQDIILFGGTIAANIAYGRPGSGPAEIEEAARKAHAHDFIRSFPQGYETVVGERGIHLSGGQRQRVAIARAILKNPAILILDEATSSLDVESEVLVQQALDVLMEGRTSIIIAHRLSTVRKADRILVMKEGRLVEAGTHDELIARPNGLYRTLCELQLHPG